MSITGYIRLIGHNHALHHHGAVLGVTDNPAMKNPEIVPRDHARNLVDRGMAEWVRDTAHVPQETPEELAARHERESADLDEHHAREHRQFVSSAGPESADVRERRHLNEQRALMHHQGAAWRTAVAAGASPEALGELRHGHAAAFAGLLGRQEAEPREQALERLRIHSGMLDHQAAERAALNARHAAEAAAVQHHQEAAA